MSLLRRAFDAESIFAFFVFVYLVAIGLLAGTVIVLIGWVLR